MDEAKNKVEAVLFITGRAMSIEEIANFCNIGSLGTVKEALKTLISEYTEKQSGLEIVFGEGKYRLTIKKQYNYLSTKLLSTCELDRPTQATLALIAYKQPVLQSDIIHMRGNTAYDHIHALEQMEFIQAEKKGRTRSIKLAPRFYEYFDVVEETLKQKFEEITEKQEKLKTEEKQATITEPEKVVAKEMKSKKKEPMVEQAIEKRDIMTGLDADDFGSKI
jgi:segregation and condensation protein B